MYVSSTADGGVVGADTKLHLVQRGFRVAGKYSGGMIRRGCLIGRIAGGTLHWRYLQREQSGELHAGHARCDLIALPDGRTRIVERFRWETREGAGTNIFDELSQ
jgi:hypothetical protein